MPAKVLSWILLMVVLAAAALWWWRDHPRLRAALAGLPVSMPVSPAMQPSSAVRKCVGAGPVVYTQDACPPGTRDQALTGGTLSVLPAAPPGTAARAGAAPAASAVPPLRRLAGEGLPPDVQERRVDQALHR